MSQDGVSVYSSLTDAYMRHSVKNGGIFIAESPKVILTALDHGCVPVSLLCERRHLEGDAASIVARCAGLPIYTGSREILQHLTGYKLTRGVLCAMRRPKLPSLSDVCKDASRIIVIDGVVDTTNIGAIFRSAAALGIGGVLLTPSSCDPLNRRTVRVSMGTVFRVPWTWLKNDVASLHAYGYTTIALALRSDALPIDHPSLMAHPRIAIVVGTEGDGLSNNVINQTDYVAKIPMSYGIDSLNVAAATAVACWQLRPRDSVNS